jgi:hypothetical protein
MGASRKSALFLGPLLGLGVHGGCRVAAPLDAPVAPIPPSEAALTTDGPAEEVGAMVRYYERQQTLDPPPELAGFVPADLAVKVVSFERRHDLLAERYAPGRHSASMVMLTLASDQEVRRTLIQHFAALGFSRSADDSEDALWFTADRHRLKLHFPTYPAVPTQVEVELDSPAAPTAATLPSLPPDLARGLGRFTVGGYGEWRTRSVGDGLAVLESAESGVAVTEYILHPKTARDGARALAAWKKDVERLGFREHSRGPGVWALPSPDGFRVRPDTPELLFVRPKNPLIGELYLRYEKRWKPTGIASMGQGEL